MGLHPEGGDDRHKVIMILLRSHRPSVESGILVLPRAVTPNERSGMVPGVRLPCSRSQQCESLTGFPIEDNFDSIGDEVPSARRGCRANTADYIP